MSDCGSCWFLYKLTLLIGIEGGKTRKKRRFLYKLTLLTKLQKGVRSSTETRVRAANVRA